MTAVPSHCAAHARRGACQKWWRSIPCPTCARSLGARPTAPAGADLQDDIVGAQLHIAAPVAVHNVLRRGRPPVVAQQLVLRGTHKRGQSHGTRTAVTLKLPAGACCVPTPCADPASASCSRPPTGLARRRTPSCWPSPPASAATGCHRFCCTGCRPGCRPGCHPGCRPGCHRGCRTPAG